MRTRPSRVIRWAGVGILLWFLVGYILYPVWTTLFASFTDNGLFTLQRYLGFFSSAASLTVLRNSIVLGALTVAACGLLGTGLAFLIHYYEFPYKNIVDKLLLLPLMMPGIIIVFAFIQLYGESGLVTKTIESVFGLKEVPYEFSGLPGILFVHAFTQYVYFYITVSLAMRQIDQSVIESARSLGASKVKVFTSVVRPYIMPALITSSAVTFMTGIGSFTAPSIMGGGYKVLTTQILLSKANNYLGLAAAQVVILTVISMSFFLLFRRYEKGRLFSGSVKGVAFKPVRIRSPWLKGLVLSTVGALLFMILLPFITIIILSFVDSASWMISIYPEKFCFDNYLAIFTKSRTFQPFFNSVTMSLLAAFICLVVAIPSSYIIEKTTFKIRWLIDVLVMLPWAMPASAVAINIIIANAEPNIFSFNSVLVGSYILLPLGYFVKSLPLMATTTHISFQNLNDAYIEASKSLGASNRKTFQKVVLPILYPGLLAGFLLVLVRSIGEYNVSAFLYTASNKPVSIAMVNAIFEYNIGLAMAYGAMLILLTAVLSAAIGRLRRG